MSRENERIIDEHLRQAAKRNAEMIGGSAVFLALFNESMVEEVIPLIQMGLAVYLDKPIVLLVPNGVRIPRNLRRMARRIEYFERSVDPTSIQEATERLMQWMQKKNL